MGKDCKSFGTIKSLISSLEFICKIFGFRVIGSAFTVKTSLKFLEGVCTNVKKSRKPFTIEQLNELCVSIGKTGVPQNLSFAEHRNFIMIIVTYCSIMQYDIVKGVRVPNLVLYSDFIKIKTPSSKMDQAGNGQVAYIISVSSIMTPALL